MVGAPSHQVQLASAISNSLESALLLLASRTDQRKNVQEAAPDLMCGISAGDLRALSNQEFDAQIFRANFTQHILKLRIAEESYQDETRVKVNVNK